MDDEVPLDVLIVEDDQGCIDLIQDVIHDLGHHTIVADSVEEALLMVRSRRLALVVLDVMLSDGDGLQVLKAIRSEPGTASTPVVLCTAALFELQSGGDLSADPFTALVLKPFHIQRFIQVVGDLLAL
jgi:CheY-like chemotaxis protein